MSNLLLVFVGTVIFCNIPSIILAILLTANQRRYNNVVRHSIVLERRIKLMNEGAK